MGAVDGRGRGRDRTVSHRMRDLLGLSIVLGLLAPGALAPVTASAADDLPPLADVPFYRADDRRSAESEPGPGPVSEPQVAWDHELDSETTSFPILVGGLLIVGTRNGNLVALDARTGEERWRAVGSGAFAGAPGADGGLVVAADATSIRAFDVATGVERWRRDVVSEAPRIEIDRWRRLRRDRRRRREGPGPADGRRPLVVAGRPWPQHPRRLGRRRRRLRESGRRSAAGGRSRGWGRAVVVPEPGRASGLFQGRRHSVRARTP